MDPLSHAAFGRTLLALARENQSSRPLAVAAALGALSPDLDALLMPIGWDLYLRFHEAGTHTIWGAFACGLLTAAVMRSFVRSASWSALAGPAAMGSLSHVLLDLISSARLRVLWPITDRHFSLPLVAMADPWLAALLVGAAVALVASRRPRRVAAVALGAAAAFLIMKATFALQAINNYRHTDLHASTVTDRIVEAKWASLREWYVIDRTDLEVRRWSTRAGDEVPRVVLSWLTPPDTALIARSRSLPVVRNFLRMHQFGLAITLAGQDGRSSVFWSDLRYCWDPMGETTSQFEPVVVRGSNYLACALWFGGEFSPEGQPVRQVVRIFGFTQTRSAGN